MNTSQSNPNAPGIDAGSGAYHQSDIGNARRFVDMFSERVRFDHDRGKWLIWNGRYWRYDDREQIIRLAKQVADRMWREVPRGKSRRQAADWGVQSAMRSRLTAMLALTQSEVGVTSKNLDSDEFLLTCESGTINLKTGALHPFESADLITRCIPAAFDPEVRSEVWEQFLRDSTGGDEELEGFLRRAVGYSLTGDTSEEKLFFVYGPEATGKSTFLTAIQNTLGDYAKTANFEAFLARRESGGPRNDIARLAGARMVVSIEVEQGKKLAEGLVKMLTGGDKISARFLYQEEFEFTPRFKLWLAANHAPSVDADDGAMWRRILVCPFIHTVPEDQRDPDLKRMLTDPRESGAAILAWAVRGCLEWQKEGLGAPEAVTAATAEYRLEYDYMGEFIEECCMMSGKAPGADPTKVVREGLIAAGNYATTKELYDAYKSWSEARGERPSASTGFGRKLRTKGFPGDRLSGPSRTRIRLGLKLNSFNGGNSF